jgi:hypothetical protein
MSKTADQVFAEALDMETRNLEKCIPLYAEAGRLYRQEGNTEEAQICENYVILLEKELKDSNLLDSIEE